VSELGCEFLELSLCFSCLLGSLLFIPLLPFPVFVPLSFLRLGSFVARTGIASTGIGSLTASFSRSFPFPCSFLRFFFLLASQECPLRSSLRGRNVVPLLAFPALLPLLYDWFWYSDRPGRGVYSPFVPFGCFQLWGLSSCSSSRLWSIQMVTT
jgi:hypothetical protein